MIILLSIYIIFGLLGIIVTFVKLGENLHQHSLSTNKLDGIEILSSVEFEKDSFSIVSIDESAGNAIDRIDFEFLNEYFGILLTVYSVVLYLIELGIKISPDALSFPTIPAILQSTFNTKMRLFCFISDDSSFPMI